MHVESEVATEAATEANAEASKAAHESEHDNSESADAGTENADGGKDTPAERTFSQKELDEIVQKRLAKVERKAERERRELLQAVTRQQPQPQQAGEKAEPKAPRREDYKSEDDWLDARLNHRESVRGQQARAAETQRREMELGVKAEALYEKAESEPGFDREEFDALPMTATMAMAVMDSDVATKLMAHLSSNPTEAARISKLPDARQAAELGKLEARLSASPKTSKAPEPVNPVGARGTTSQNLEKADYDTYLKMRAKQGARWARRS